MFSVSVAKVRKTITLDTDLVEALGDDDAALSFTINTILRDEVDRRQRSRALSDLLGRLEAEREPVEEKQVVEFRRMLR